MGETNNSIFPFLFLYLGTREESGVGEGLFLLAAKLARHEGWPFNVNLEALCREESCQGIVSVVLLVL